MIRIIHVWLEAGEKWKENMELKEEGHEDGVALIGGMQRVIF